MYCGEILRNDIKILFFIKFSPTSFTIHDSCLTQFSAVTAAELSAGFPSPHLVVGILLSERSFPFIYIIHKYELRNSCFIIWIVIFTIIILCLNCPIFASESSFKRVPMPLWCFSITLWALRYILELPYFQVHLVLFLGQSPQLAISPKGSGKTVLEDRARKSIDAYTQTHTHTHLFLKVVWKHWVHTNNSSSSPIQPQDSF